jgi:drug/metabolite transporter (DMT)-like permease
MPISRANLTRGYTLALISAVFLSTTAIFIRYLTQTFHMPALVLACWRDGFVALTLFLALSLKPRHLLNPPRKDLPYLITYGLVLAVFNALWTLSVALNGAAVSTVLAYSSAGFTALLGRLFLKEELGWGKVLAVVFSLAGCILVAGAHDPLVWQTNTLGLVTGIGSGLLYAIYTLLGRSATQRGLNPWTTILYTFGCAAVFLLGFNLLPVGMLPGAAVRPADMFWLGNAWQGWLVLFLLAAVPTLLGFGLYNSSLIYLPSSVANLIVTLEPVFTAIIAYFLFGELLDKPQILGSLLILTGVVFLRIYEGGILGTRPVEAGD